MVVAVWLSRSGFARFDSYLLFVDQQSMDCISHELFSFLFSFFLRCTGTWDYFYKICRRDWQILFFQPYRFRHRCYYSGIARMVFFSGSFAAVVLLCWQLFRCYFITQKNKWLVIIFAFAGIYLHFTGSYNQLIYRYPNIKA